MPTLPMKIGVPLDEMSILFFASLGAAIWLVYLFCQKKFAEPSNKGNGEFIYQLLPRQLATGEEYSHGFTIYFGSMALMVVLLSLLGASNLEQLGIALPKQLSYVGLPLAIAFVLMGALPNVPGLMVIETFLRQYAHERAYIPDAARATADRLAAAEFDFTSYQGEALQSPEMRGVEPADFTRSRHTLEHVWARLCCLVFVQKSFRIEGLTGALDAGLLRYYQRDLELVESQKKSMEAKVAAYRAARASDSFYTDEGLRRDIVDNLYKLYILLGCAVRLKAQPNDDIDLVLKAFGFKLTRTPRRPGNEDLKLVCLAAVAFSTTVLGLAAEGLGWFRLWQMSDVYPQTVLQPFVDTVSTLVPHAIGIVIADLMRRRALNKGSWFVAAGHPQRGSVANYVRVAGWCGVAGYLGLVLWGLTQGPPTPASFKIEIPNALLAMVTGWFYVYHLDNAETRQRPSPAWELGSESVLTGLCGLIAASATWQITWQVAGGMDKVILTTVINAAVGFVVAWYIPQAAAAGRLDPFAHASQERVQALETAAKARLGESTDWCDRSHPVLGGTSPRVAAAANVDGFERAVDLLQGPSALSA